jgi:hypothetical protein
VQALAGMENEMNIKAKLIKPIEGLEHHYITGNTYGIEVGEFKVYDLHSKTKLTFKFRTTNHRGVQHGFSEELLREHFETELS